jgi:hypothetical protein
MPCSLHWGLGSSGSSEVQGPEFLETPALPLGLIHRSAQKGKSRKFAAFRGSLGSWLPQGRSSRIHRRSLGYWWGGSLPSEQLLLLSRVARWFPHGPPFALTPLFTWCVEVEFSEVRRDGVLRSSAVRNAGGVSGVKVGRGAARPCPTTKPPVCRQATVWT